VTSVVGSQPDRAPWHPQGSRCHGHSARSTATRVLSGEAPNVRRSVESRVAHNWHPQPREENRQLLIAGGETTVTVTGAGSGGGTRSLHSPPCGNCTDIMKMPLLTAGSDGVDGPTDAAGAYVDGWDTWTRRKAGHEVGRPPHPQRLLSLLRRPQRSGDDRFLPGPNVADISLGLVRR
jgi:hypothetical protein